VPRPTALLFIVPVWLAACDVCGSKQECGVELAPSDANDETGAPCTAQDDAGYPASGCGTVVGSIIDDFEWTGRLSGITSPVTTLRLHDYYNPDGSKPTKFMFITVSAFWCQACKDEAKDLNGVLTKYGGKGVMVVTDIAQKVDTSIADAGDVDVWIKTFGLQTAVVNDPGFVLQKFFNPSTMPLDLIIDLRTMRIVYKTTGAVLPSVEAFLDSVVGS